jgi:hypothetical protein
MSLANQKELGKAKLPKGWNEGDRYLFKCRDCTTSWVDSDLEWMRQSATIHNQLFPDHHVIVAKIIGLANGDEYVPPQ